MRDVGSLAPNEKLNLTEAGRMLGVSRVRVSQFIAEGRLRTVAHGARKMIRKSTVEKFARIVRKTGWKKGRARGPHVWKGGECL